MSFNTKGQDVNTGDSKSLSYGNVYAHIHSTTVKKSSTGKKMLEIILEGPTEGGDFEGYPVDRENPEGPKFKGKMARVQGTTYIDEAAYSSNDVLKNEIIHRLVYIAKELQVKDQLDNINAETLEEWVEKATDLIKGNDMHFLVTAAEEEYNGKKILKRSLAKFKFCSLDAEKVEKFDKTNKYHFKPLQKSENVENFEPAAQEDFDFK
jgi:hypothetical protein